MENKGLTLLDNIPQTSHTYLYLERWANGKEGSITDSNGHGIYRFFPMKRDANGNRIDEQTNFDDYETNPIVATGIIGYWLHFRKNRNRLASYTTWTKEDERKDTLKIFTDYTVDKLNQYIEREQDAPDSWRRNLTREFYTEFIIQNEKPLNKQNEALMEYITPSDRQMVRDVMAEYMLFLEEKRRQFKTIPKGEKPSGNFVPTGQTFVKTTKVTDLQLTLIMQRLSMSHKLDPDANADDWLKLFSGVDSKFTMKWLGTPGELRDLFDMLTQKSGSKDTGYVIPRYGYQKIVLSHFTDKDGKYFDKLKGQKSISSFQPLLDDCNFMLQFMTERMTEAMKTIIREHKAELQEQGLHYNTTAAKNDDRQKVRNKL